MASLSLQRIIVYLLITTLIAGTLDISAALLNYYFTTGKDPLNVLRFVASGAMGNSAFTGEPQIPWIGLLVHYGVTLGWVCFFFLTYKLVWARLRSIGLMAVLYGIFVYFLMNFVVLPLTAAPGLQYSLLPMIKEILILIVCIGLPVAFSARRYFRAG